MRVSNEVLDVLGQSICDGHTLTLPARLERALYTKVAAAIDAAGGRWDRRANAHVFGADAATLIDAILMTGTVTREKQELGQFDSPPPVVDRVMAKAAIEPGMTVLEPSAGLGNLAVAAIAAGARVTTCEIDPKRAAALLFRITDLHRNGSWPAAIVCEGMLCDFLTADPDKVGRFDRVVMNPPFAQQAEIDHVMHATRFLKAGSRLVSVMSAGALFRTNVKAKAFRAFVEDFGGWFEELPEHAFAASGTSVRAVILTLPGMPA